MKGRDRVWSYPAFADSIVLDISCARVGGGPTCQAPFASVSSFSISCQRSSNASEMYLRKISPRPKFLVIWGLRSTANADDITTYGVEEVSVL